ACNQGGSCSGAAASCPGTPTNCDDGDACTDDGCAPSTGCTHTPRASCGGGDAGVVVPHTPEELGPMSSGCGCNGSTGGLGALALLGLLARVSRRARSAPSSPTYFP